MIDLRASICVVAALAVHLAGCVVKDGTADEPVDAGLGVDGGTDGPVGPTSCGDVPVTGRCVDATHLETCFVPENADPAHALEPTVLQRECPPGLVCSDGDGKAICQPTGSCRDGDSHCKTKYEVQRCVDGAWVVEPCGTSQCVQNPGAQATCVANAPSGHGPHLTGNVQYMRRTMLADKSNLGDPAPAPAVGVVASVFDGDEYLGGAYTGSDGSLDVELSRAPGPDTAVFVFPMYFDEQGKVRLAVVQWGNPQSEYDLSASDYWYFGFATGSSLDVGTLLIGEEDGSGAVNIYETLLYGLQTAYALHPEVTQQSLAAIWSPGKAHGCGNPESACYYSNAYGGVVMPYEGGSDYLQTAIALPGTDDSPKQWQVSVILHELGHYMMDTYSRAPGVGGPHTLTDNESPAQAWSEGYATFYGQSTLGHGLYFAKSNGTSWWFQIDHVDSNYFHPPMPDPEGTMSQPIGELFVGAAMWHLWSGPDVQSGEPWDTAAVGDDRTWRALMSSHVTKSYASRGYGTPDLVDWLDALSCLGVPSSDLHAVLDHYGFPYDYAAPCP